MKILKIELSLSERGFKKPVLEIEAVEKEKVFINPRHRVAKIGLSKKAKIECIEKTFHYRAESLQSFVDNLSELKKSEEGWVLKYQSDISFDGKDYYLTLQFNKLV